MSTMPEPPRALPAGPALPEIPDRLLRSRWLASTGDQFAIAYTSVPTSCNFIGIPETFD